MGAAFSMGAFALSTMFLPLIMMGVFGMMSFGAFATMGMFLVIPKLILTFVSVVSGMQSSQHSTAQHSTAQRQRQQQCALQQQKLSEQCSSRHGSDNHS
jgi:hypothetical protein